MVCLAFYFEKKKPHEAAVAVKSTLLLFDKVERFKQDINIIYCDILYLGDFQKEGKKNSCNLRHETDEQSVWNLCVNVSVCKNEAAWCDI